MMRGRVNRFRTGSGFSHPHTILCPWRRREFAGLLLLVLCAGAAQGQTIAGHLAVDFGTSPIGAGVTRSVFTLAPATDTVIDSITTTGANSGDFAIAAGGCSAGSTVTAGTSCAVSVTFTPTAGGCRQALLRVASHDVATNQTFLDVVGLIGSGLSAAPPDTVPLTLPLTIRTQGSPVITPIAGSVESSVTVNPTVLATRGGLNQLSVQGTVIPATAGTPLTSVGTARYHLVGTLFAFTGLDTLDLCSVTTAVPGPTGLPTVQEIFYVVSGTGRFAGATGNGTIVSTADATGVVSSQFTGTLTLRIPTGPFSYIYLADLLHSY
jgi:hypothetical protein